EPKGNVTSKGSASLPIYFDASGVAQTITSYDGLSSSATYAVKSSSIAVTTTSTSAVWATIDTNGTQGWRELAAGEAISEGAGVSLVDNVISVSTGTGLDIDSQNKVVVTTAPAAQKIDNQRKIIVTSDDLENDLYYVWGAEANSSNTDIDESKQGWIQMKIHRSYGRNYLTGADLAEIYQSTEKLVPGDVVSIDPAKDNAIVKTKVAEDTMVAGVISTEPGVLMNQDEKGYKLALVGKVPTKVCNEGGAIKRGDLLVSASIPGYAKKAGDNPKVGTVIGKALENSDSQKGTILVLVNLQ
ncbi:MAG: hypothetical protein IKN62_07190, partial [Elusimicrobia bacterium]|nr:hypothetical protein [Elusimicrobiota bacterium]